MSVLQCEENVLLNGCKINALLSEMNDFVCRIMVLVSQLLGHEMSILMSEMSVSLCEMNVLSYKMNVF